MKKISKGEQTMTNETKEIAKDFAEYLVDKFYNEINVTTAEAKQCALIAVEEIENFYDSQFDLEGSKTEAYLNEVKKQIDSL